MKRDILVVVGTNNDKVNFIETLCLAVPLELILHARMGRQAVLALENGDRFQVWSVEQWWSGITCGKSFQQVMYLVDPVPQFVKESLRSCMEGAYATQ
ncbi:MAG: hypothetical protein DRJ03_02055 [Chloroflexi bacterium]|nr:MAG: hypothetical protein DRJ03_02055 [Chloroflexota bacterium]